LYPGWSAAAGTTPGWPCEKGWGGPAGGISAWGGPEDRGRVRDVYGAGEFGAGAHPGSTADKFEGNFVKLDLSNTRLAGENPTTKSYDPA
jgi:hypothetical protein